MQNEYVNKILKDGTKAIKRWIATAQKNDKGNRVLYVNIIEIDKLIDSLNDALLAAEKELYANSPSQQSMIQSLIDLLVAAKNSVNRGTTGNTVTMGMALAEVLIENINIIINYDRKTTMQDAIVAFINGVKHHAGMIIKCIPRRRKCIGCGVEIWWSDYAGNYPVCSERCDRESDLPF